MMHETPQCASASLTHGAWRPGVFVTNLTNKYEILDRGLQDPTTNYLSYTQSFNPPRQIYMRVGYSFKICADSGAS
jgi:outer membrane receptor protein involved in Fe transport